MGDFIRYQSAGYGDRNDNNAKEVCDWIHGRIQRYLGHGAERVFYCGDGTIAIQLVTGKEIPIPLGTYVYWDDEPDDFTHGSFVVVSPEERESDWQWKLRLGESINGARNDLKSLLSDASLHRGGPNTDEFRTLVRAEELLGIFESVMGVLADVYDRNQEMA